MLSWSSIAPMPLSVHGRIRSPQWQCRRCLVSNIRKTALLSKTYVPTSKIDKRQPGEGLRSVQYLLKAGFIRQSSTGIYSLLPFGQRVIEKLERIIEEEMYSIDASKVSLPNLLPPALWQQSGRWESTGAELWRLTDRRQTEMLLAPTHEEEITALVSSDVISERSLPVRLFQIGRKFRDEARPRGGLLRGREFSMKDLYTFDATVKAAEQTYEEVKSAYCRIFDRIGVPYSVAEADSGNIGGTSSHEFHYLSPAGEDTLITCPKCSYTANSELARSRLPATAEFLDAVDCKTTLLDLPTKQALGIAITRKGKSINMVKVKKIDPNAREIGFSKPLDSWDGLQILLDESCAALEIDAISDLVDTALRNNQPNSIWPAPPSYHVGDFRVAEEGQGCTQCGSSLEASTSVEVGHTFLLGTKYSKALNASFAPTNDTSQTRQYFQMGCYGIGVSRLLGSVAEVLADDKGLVWPPSIAPFQTCVIALDPQAAADALPLVETQTGGDIILDDRYGLSFGKRMKDAELIGYPLLVILGQKWHKEGQLEVQVRVTGEKAFCEPKNLPAVIQRIYATGNGSVG